MKIAAKNLKSAPDAPKNHGWSAPLLLLIVLAVLFWRSFLPGFVHFSNDGPLGMQNSAWLHLPEGFMGSWYDLNSIGNSAGAFSPSITSVVRWVIGAVGCAKFLAPIALWILGVGAWFCFRQMKLSPLAAVLGGLAAALSSDFFSSACWGVASQQIAIGMDFFALGIVAGNSPAMPALTRWTRLALAGLCVGMNVMEAADIGAIFSVFIAAFVFCKALTDETGSRQLTRFEYSLVSAFLLAFDLFYIWGIMIQLGLGFIGFKFDFGFGKWLSLAIVVVLHWRYFSLQSPWKIQPVSPTQANTLVKLFERSANGIIYSIIVAVFAGFLALQTVLALVGSTITGIVGTGQDAETKLHHWDWATQWSMPKAETFGLVVPGLFGYKLDTPKDMMPALQSAYKGGEYWGGVGRDPAIDRYFDSGRRGDQPPGFMRFTGGGNYLGILVVLLAAFAVAQSFRRENSPLTETQRRIIWFWAVLLVGSMLLSWGRFAPFKIPLFYEWIYNTLPGLSSVRNPAKFVLTLAWATVILFAYGVHILSRRYLEVPAGSSSAASAQLINWWEKVRGFDRKWTLACVGTFGGSALAWLIYASQKPGLVKYLESVGFPDPAQAGEVAGFSIGQVGWFVLIFAAAVALCILILAGVFSGKRARLGEILLGVLLVFDLGRANLPYIIHWDYAQKYEIGTLNPIVDFLKDKPYEHRVAYGLPSPLSTPEPFQVFDELYRIEWAQHHFPYYNIQSLDIVQMSRMPADLAAFDGTFQIGIMQDSSGRYSVAPETFPRVTRRWELTNTRYLLGPASLLDLYNEQFDPGQHRFRIVKRFDVVLKPGVDEFHQRLEELTAVPAEDNNGKYTTFCKDLALFEFTGALPRAKLYSNWQVSTNDAATLKLLADKNFDPQQTVLVSTSLPAAPAANANSGTVDFKSYKPADIVFDTKSDTASVLLLNDRYDANWHVSVDGKPAELLRCNFIMRGVYLPPGSHTVEFRFTLPNKPLYVTIAAMVVGVFLLGLLIFLERRKPVAV